MGKASYNDVKNAGKKMFDEVHASIERQSDEKAQKIADAIIADTKRGNGLWFIVKFPMAVMITGIFAGALVELIVRLGKTVSLSLPAELLYAPAAAVAMYIGYRSYKSPNISTHFIIAIVSLLVMVGMITK